MEDRKPYERYHNFRLGWRDQVKGVSRTEEDFKVTEDTVHLALAYSRGQDDARGAYSKALEADKGFEYLVGWNDGALGVHLDDQYLKYNSDLYKMGRVDGRKARDVYERQAEDRYKYTPSMFRESMGEVPTCLR